MADLLSAEAVAVARAVVTRWHAGELEAFEDLVEAYRADPDGTVRGVRLGAPVGIGIDLAAVTPWVLAAVSAAGGVLVEKAAEDAWSAGRRWLSRVWGRGGAPAAEEAEQATVVITVHLTGLGAAEPVARAVAEQVVRELGGRDDSPTA
ncbi:hypothetical protein [Actinosynnema mirum]|uniref:Uncharacterized protein n=1 Tax=Actinosynnema mirum (strain ATCC 29888 / DSM 43827 / JCM 3225 / NBRC 14064 / NCIMB 13271 / NRRL B-12336 / IMRU 3971 / 101) TaxID=446462 RepID=C6WBV6_ACTMD|nr:hypothetical protein [Actinosynnema mirum]ACU37523.1 hypothetical protein Amir_3636 [Actinosynnema mirum DSM 43827]